MQNNGTRMSNIELLRITAMVMIIIYHIICVVKDELTTSGLIEKFDNGLYCHPFFHKKLFLIQGIMPFGMTGNAIFLMISGYFYINTHINIAKIAKKLILQLSFAVTLMTMISFGMFLRYKSDQSIPIAIKTISDFCGDENWFIGYYFLIMIVAHLFLNKKLSCCNEMQYKSFLLASYAIFTLGYSGGVADALASGLRVVGIGVFYYGLGGYIKQYNPFQYYKMQIMVMLLILSYVLLFVSYFNLVQGGIRQYSGDTSQNGFMQPFLGINY